MLSGKRIEEGSDPAVKRRRTFMVQMMIEIPEEALGALRRAPQDFAREMRLAAAVKWYEMKLLSQERAAGVAGLSRAEFLDALGRFGVSPFQYGPDEILEEASRG
jgi:predicted HTH domain antitoxin